MRVAVKIFIYFALVAFYASSAAAAFPSLKSAGTSALAREIEAEVTFLSDSTCFGREFGTGGDTGAAFYIYRQLASAGYQVEFQSFRAAGRVGRNVIARTPGVYSRYIVVGAYYDGLGVIEGVRYPGADTNASGVAGLLALARNFSSSRGPVGFVFVAFDGHDADLAGSEAFLESFRHPVSMMVNLDTIGSDLEPVVRHRPDYLIALGGASYSEGLEWANRSVGLHLSYDYYGNKGFTDLFYQRAGDQKWFLQKGIPCVMFTSGVTMNTNKPSDKPSSLNYILMVKRLRVIAGWLQSLL